MRASIFAASLILASSFAFAAPGDMRLFLLVGNPKTGATEIIGSKEVFPSKEACQGKALALVVEATKVAKEAGLVIITSACGTEKEIHDAIAAGVEVKK